MIKLEAEKKHKSFYMVAGIVLLVGLISVFVFRYYLLRAVAPSDEETASTSIIASSDLSLDLKSLKSLNNFQPAQTEKASTTLGNTNPFSE